MKFCHIVQASVSKSKIIQMKKIILHSLFAVVCFAFVTSCSKEVKTPVKTTTTTTTTTTTGTQTEHQGGHCGGDGGDQHYNSGGGH